MGEIEKNFQKIERQVRQIGLGDGLSSGKDSNFQGHFNKGFAEGFRNAHAIGSYKGAIFAQSMLKNNAQVPESELLTHPKVAWCEFCTDKELISKSLPEIVARQTQICDKNLKQLHSIYSKEIPSNVKLPDSL